jgi:hypothetical protein
MIHNFERKVFSVESSSIYKSLKVLQNYTHTHSIYPFGESLHYMDKRSEFSLEDMQQYLKNEGLQDLSIKSITPEIEDIFMELSTR